MESTTNHTTTRRFGLPASLWLLALLSTAALLFWSSHRSHVITVLPFLILAACPLMHFFMHKDHGHHSSPPADSGHRDDESSLPVIPKG